MYTVSPLLCVQVAGILEFVVKVAAALCSGDGIVYAEHDVLRDPVCLAINVLTMWCIQGIPVTGFQ